MDTWKNGCISEYQAFYSSQRWARVVLQVWERDKELCQRCACGKGCHPERPMHIHHRTSFRTKELRATLNNLVLLCTDCHHFVHSTKNVEGDFLSVRETHSAMKYTDYSLKRRPVSIACKLAEEMGYEYKVRQMKCDDAGCSGPFVNIIASWQSRFWGIGRRPIFCAGIELPQFRSCTVRIYGEEHKEAMLRLAERLKSQLSVVPERYWHGGFEVEFFG